MDYLIIMVLSYLIGSIPNGLIVGKLMGLDLREHGSRNIGATNAYRVLGLWPALVVFVTDALKGIAGVYIGQYFNNNPEALLTGGIFAIIGHNWSIFLKLQGGRGVATGLGVIAVLTPKVTAIVFTVWLIIVLITKYVSLGSIVAAALVPICMLALNEPVQFLYFGILAAAFVIYRHKPNIKRLLKGEELKIKAGSAANSKKEK